MPFPIVSRNRIEREAKAAAERGETLSASCPYPFTDPAGEAFREVFNQHRATLIASRQVPTSKVPT